MSRTQVNANGVLSFGTSFGDFTPDPFPLPTRINTLIALHWADHNVRLGDGEIFYRISEDTALLSEIGTNISVSFSTNFSPSSLFIATWENVREYLSSAVAAVSMYVCMASNGACDIINTYV